MSARRTLRPELPLGLSAAPRTESELRKSIQASVLAVYGITLDRADSGIRRGGFGASTVGLPDLFGPVRRLGGKLLGIETKMPSAYRRKNEAAQTALLDRWQDDGAIVIRRARSFDDVRRVLDPLLFEDAARQLPAGVRGGVT